MAFARTFDNANVTANACAVVRLEEARSPLPSPLSNRKVSIGSEEETPRTARKEDASGKTLLTAR